MEISPQLKHLLNRETIDSDRREMVESYFESWDADDIIDAKSVSMQLETFDHRPLPSTVVIIPVAAHTEAKNVTNALAQYARQQDADPFAVHLHLNWPSERQNDPGVFGTMQKVIEAQRQFPDLDIRVSTMEYDEPVIGHIRRSAWNGTLLNLLANGTDLSTAIGINHDIDVTKMSRFYIKRVQDYFKKIDSDGTFRPFLPPANTQLKHQFDPRYPYTSRAVFWTDFACRTYRSGYEAGIVIPFATYASASGFNRGAKTHETGQLTRLYRGSMDMIPGTHLETSVRRYLDRLPEFVLGSIWTESSFGADDNCRTAEKFEDISYERLADMMSWNATEFGELYMMSLLKLNMTHEQRAALTSNDDDRIIAVAKELCYAAMRSYRSVQFVLRNVVQVPEVDDYLQKHYFNELEIWDRIMLYRQRLRKSSQDLRSLLNSVRDADDAVIRQEEVL